MPAQKNTMDKFCIFRRDEKVAGIQIWHNELAKLEGTSFFMDNHHVGLKARGTEYQQSTYFLVHETLDILRVSHL